MDRDAVDRFGNPIEVGSTVTYAYNDRLRGGTVAYIAPEIAELVIKDDDSSYGLITRQGDAAGSGLPHKASFDDVIVRT